MTELVSNSPDASVDREPAAFEETRAEAWTSNHLINIRTSILLPAGRHYVTFVAGKECRSPERREQQRKRHPLVTKANMVFLFTVGFVIGGACWIALDSMVRWLWSAIAA